MASGGAAMDLMGQWAPGRVPNQAGVDPKASCRSSSAGSRSRWSTAAPVPATDAFGGGDGFAVGKDAPPEAVDFLEFITNVDNQPRSGRTEQRPSR